MVLSIKTNKAELFSNCLKTYLVVILSAILIIQINITGASKPFKSKKGMVVSASKISSKVGVEILKAGGNAVDAAVAVGFALAVTYPYAGNIGGGGFMVIHLQEMGLTPLLISGKELHLQRTGICISIKMET